MLFQGALMKDRDKGEVHCGGHCQYCPAPHTWDTDLNFLYSAINSLLTPLAQGLSTPASWPNANWIIRLCLKHLFISGVLIG